MNNDTRAWAQWACEQARQPETKAAQAPSQPREAPATWAALIDGFFRKWRHLNRRESTRRQVESRLAEDHRPGRKC